MSMVDGDGATEAERREWKQPKLMVLSGFNSGRTKKKKRAKNLTENKRRKEEREEKDQFLLP
jgi:hypothetical protein